MSNCNEEFNFESLLKEIIDLHNDFSEDLKNFDLSFMLECPIVSQDKNTGFFNNDLRYALRSSIDLLSIAKLPNTKQSQESISRLSATINILYQDLLDYTVSYSLEYIENIYLDYPANIVNKIAKSEIDNLKKITQIIKPLIAESRRTRSDRVELYKNIYKKHYSELLKFYQELLSKVEIISIASCENNNQLKTTKKQFHITLGLSLLFGVFSVISIII
jgi:hypothetical protein